MAGDAEWTGRSGLGWVLSQVEPGAPTGGGSPQEPKRARVGIGADLYSGAAGVLFGCAEARLGGRADADDLALLMQDRLVAAPADPHTATAAAEGEQAGLYIGVAGQLVGLRTWARVAEDPAAAAAADRRCARAWQWTGDRGDHGIISGDAGILLALLHATTDTALAAKIGDRLLAAAVPAGAGLDWTARAGVPFLVPNFSHGGAGIAYALAAAAGPCGRSDFLTAAAAGATRVAELGDHPTGWVPPTPGPNRTGRPRSPTAGAMGPPAPSGCSCSSTASKPARAGQRWWTAASPPSAQVGSTCPPPPRLAGRSRPAPHGAAHPLRGLDHPGQGLMDKRADLREPLASPVVQVRAERIDPPAGPHPARPHSRHNNHARCVASGTSTGEDHVTAMDEVAAFEAERPRLVRMAGRLLRDPVEAEDIVQQAWLRLQRTDQDIVNLPGWLTTVTTRLCLDRLRAKVPVPEEPFEVAGQVGDPADQVALADTVGVALQIVLDRLAPAERVAFVLHDSFGFEFAIIAAMLETTPGAARKLASRARAKVAQPAAEDALADWEVVDAFLSAARGGDVDRLLVLLAPDVVVTGDAAAVALGTPERIAGRRDVADFFNGAAKAAGPVFVGDRPGAAWLHHGQTKVAFDFTVVGGTITRVEFRADPGVLARVRRRRGSEQVDRGARD